MKRSKRVLGLAITFALLVSMFPAGLALAQDSGPIIVDTNAVVDGQNGAQPAVNFKFELQTENRDQNVAGPWRPDAVLFPNLEDDPLAFIGYWWIASHPAGINALTDGFVRVWHPGDNPEEDPYKYQLHGNIMTCDQLGHENTPGTPLWAAIQSGQFDLSNAAQLREDCIQQQVRIYHVFGEISKHQACGDYTVRATAVGEGGGSHTLENIMNVGCIVGLDLDFTSVDYGQIIPGVPKVIDGDWVFQDGSKMTVKNTGNVDMHLGLQFSAMVGAEFEKVIDVFDATLRWREDPTNNSDPGIFQTFDPIPAGNLVCFDGIPLGSNEIGKLELSIHPPAELVGDIYTGELALTGWIDCPAV